MANAPGAGMTETEYLRKVDEVDRLLNDPTVSMDPARIWALLADIAQHTGSLANGVGGTDGKIQSSEGAKDPTCVAPRLDVAAGYVQE
jgi:hypothetical protein